MKKYLYIILFLYSSSSLGQVNLVPNPSFEEYDLCTEVINSFNLANYYGLKYWLSPNYASPDLLASCNISLDFQTPQNWGGNQIATTGDCIVGLGNTLYGFVGNYREFVQAELIHSLERDKKYCFTMFISLMDSCWIATDNFGVYISDTAIYSHSGGLFGFVPQITNPLGNVLDDKINWTEISGEYIAHGGEKYITIGIFEDDNQINTFPQPFGSIHWQNTNYNVLGYYLDDVSLILCEDTIAPISPENSLNIPNAFTPNSDGVNDVFRGQGDNIKTLNGKIINRWGQELYEWTDVDSGWDGKYKGKDAEEGTYFYYIMVVFEDGDAKVEKGSVLLTR